MSPALRFHAEAGFFLMSDAVDIIRVWTVNFQNWPVKVENRPVNIRFWPVKFSNRLANQFSENFQRAKKGIPPPYSLLLQRKTAFFYSFFKKQLAK
jgi:hypothetical protein